MFHRDWFKLLPVDICTNNKECPAISTNSCPAAVVTQLFDPIFLYWTEGNSKTARNQRKFDQKNWYCCSKTMKIVYHSDYRLQPKPKDKHCVIMYFLLLVMPLILNSLMFLPQAMPVSESFLCLILTPFVTNEIHLKQFTET